MRLLIDAGPDLRQQLLRANISHLEAILLTHEHKDHTGGLDDVRALNFVDYPEAVHPVEVYGTERTLTIIRKDYDYAFALDKYRGVPLINLHTIDPTRPFTINGVAITPIRGAHSSRFETTGFRIEGLAYLTDFKLIEEEELKKLEGVEVLVVNALRPEPHDSHWNLEEALSIIDRIKPRRALLTHASHEMGLHAERQALLPEGVELAYDGLEIEL